MHFNHYPIIQSYRQSSSQKKVQILFVAISWRDKKLISIQSSCHQSSNLSVQSLLSRAFSFLISHSHQSINQPLLDSYVSHFHFYKTFQNSFWLLCYYYCIILFCNFNWTSFYCEFWFVNEVVEAIFRTKLMEHPGHPGSRSSWCTHITPSAMEIHTLTHTDTNTHMDDYFWLPFCLPHLKSA